MPIFSSLRTFKMPKNLPATVNQKLVMIPLMAPTLRKIGVFAPDPLAKSYLKQLSNAAPNFQLKHIRIYGRSTFSCWHSVLRFSKLEYLDMNFHGSYDPFIAQLHFTEFLEQLSTLEGLSSLLLSVPTFIAPGLPPGTSFQQLRRLALTGSTIAFSAICRLTPRIEYLVLESVYAESSNNWKVFFQALPELCPFLKQILVYGKFVVVEKCLSAMEFIEPLLRLDLEGLCLRSHLPLYIYLSDTNITTMAEAWPGLISLEVFVDGHYISPNIPSMHGLRSIFGVCQDIAYLRMSCWNKVVDLSTRRRRFSMDTLDNTYPPFVDFLS